MIQANECELGDLKEPEGVEVEDTPLLELLEEGEHEGM